MAVIRRGRRRLTAVAELWQKNYYYKNPPEVKSSVDQRRQKAGLNRNQTWRRISKSKDDRNSAAFTNCRHLYVSHDLSLSRRLSRISRQLHFNRCGVYELSEKMHLPVLLLVVQVVNGVCSIKTRVEERHRLYSKDDIFEDQQRDVVVVFWV